MCNCGKVQQSQQLVVYSRRKAAVDKVGGEGLSYIVLKCKFKTVAVT
jgi:hypothetical protein